MNGHPRIASLIPLALLLLAGPARAQGGDVYWHIDPRFDSCSMVIDPSLTQAQWQTFVRQAGDIVAYRSLAPAEPLGKGRFTFGLDYSVTPIHQRDPAWINTFAHPDASCPLGDQIKLPMLRANLGVTSRMDVAGFWTSAPGANYGLAGGAIKYGFLRESARVPAAAVTASFTNLTGVADFDFFVTSLELSASKRFAAVSPFVGFRHSLAVGTETTSKVDLSRETIPLTHGFVGAAGSIWKLGVAAEYDVATVRTFAFRLGLQP